MSKGVNSDQIKRAKAVPLLDYLLTPAAQTAACFEAPIDTMSHACLVPDFKSWRLSLGGTALAALTNFLKYHAKVNTVIVCTDNDEAGSQAAARIAELPDVTVKRSPPPNALTTGTRRYNKSETR